ncbi:MAG: response regulator transcription factor [Erysipelotrichaceae bacterium]|nr:response regulator transcription factor [Erysipelotrichaceae bacterium]
MFKILIAEDDNELRQLFKSILVKNGYNVKSVGDGMDALTEIKDNYYDLLISDVMMPRLDGYELVRILRENNIKIPVMMITAKDKFDDMQLGFLVGSDEYMIKPINLNEMVIRVAALLRRAQIINERKVILGNTILEYDTFTVNFDGESIVLPLKEFQVLYKLASFPGKIFTRQQLMVDIWGYDSDSDMHTVDVHIERLRKKLKNNVDFEIVTMRGIGYKVVKK